MPEHSLIAADALPVARTLLRKADEALIDGDRDRVMEFVTRLYNLLDWQVAWARQANVERLVRRRTRAGTYLVH